MPDQSLTLVRNDKYWGTPAKADKIVMRVITDDTASAQALANGEVQVIQPQPDPDLLNQLQGLSGVTDKVNGGFTFEHFDVNFQTPLFQDKAVRQALAYCVPRQDMVDKLIKPLDPNAKSAPEPHVLAVPVRLQGHEWRRVQHGRHRQGEVDAGGRRATP